MHIFRTLLIALVVSLLIAGVSPVEAQSGETVPNGTATTATETGAATATPATEQNESVPNGTATTATETGAATATPATEQTETPGRAESETGALVDRLGGDQCAAPRAIDNSTVLCEARLDGEEAVLVLRSDLTQRVTVTDAGAFLAGGRVPRQTATLREGERNTVRMSITMVDGFAGVSVDTGRTLFAVPLERQQSLIGGPWSSGDATVAALAGATSVVVVVVVQVIRYMAGRTTEPERVA